MSSSSVRERPGPPMVLRLFDLWATVYRRTWRGSVISSFITPLLYVVAMGVLLGGFVKADPARLEGAHSYLAFVAPGMVAAQTMTLCFGEMTWPVMAAIKWQRQYLAMIATPLEVRDVVLGHLGFLAFRVASSSAVFLAVLAPFGVFDSVLGALGAFVVQILLGMAFAAPIYAITASAQNENVLSLMLRVVMVPLFLFSGAFFPITNLALPLEWLARVTPLWQGVDLTRMLTVGDLRGGLALYHLGYLVVLAAGGGWFAVRALERRLKR